MNARASSFKILKEIFLKESYSNLVLRHELQLVEEQQRPMITQIVYGTLENYMYVRFAWKHLVASLPNPETCVLLDMSVYQLLFMDNAPAYATVNESVDICKHYISGKMAKLVNAVLRNVHEQGVPSLPENPLEALSIKTSHPLWLLQMWSAQYGEDVCRKICEGNMHPRKSVGRVNTCKISRDDFLKQDATFRKSLVSEDGVVFEGGNIAATHWFQEGYLSIQDEASQLVAFTLDPQPHERILDVCSAPGTKACHIATRMNDQGEVICGDIHEHRVTLIKEGAMRLGLQNIHAQVLDACHITSFPQASFDRVLCDVPCSGYGTLSRKSDIKVRMKSSDMDTLIPLQANILKESASMVKNGGYLVYSTCTLNKKENEKQVERFLKEHQEFVLLHQETIFPFVYDSDGFYIAKLQRIEKGAESVC